MVLVVVALEAASAGPASSAIAAAEAKSVFIISSRIPVKTGA
jgi:hypothetical protein